MQHAQADALRLFLYLAFALPLLAPLVKFTHVQLSVISLVALQALVWLAVQHEPSDNHNSSQAAEA